MWHETETSAIFLCFLIFPKTEEHLPTWTHLWEDPGTDTLKYLNVAPCSANDLCIISSSFFFWSWKWPVASVAGTFVLPAIVSICSICILELSIANVKIYKQPWQGWGSQVGGWGHWGFGCSRWDEQRVWLCRASLMSCRLGQFLDEEASYGSVPISSPKSGEQNMK